jgi:hypothetical protein
MRPAVACHVSGWSYSASVVLIVCYGALRLAVQRSGSSWLNPQPGFVSAIR